MCTVSRRDAAASNSLPAIASIHSGSTDHLSPCSVYVGRSLFGGSLSFDHHSHDWEAFKVRLTQFCVANGVTDENDKISGVGALFSLRRSPKTQCEWRQVW
ncbi:hypothetical protein EVAR_77620_1 [Eumeta japonica]|uniref:Uncharacterized protein n=1 Tax=Eumeta variegata TaxID=151549 RepID=A0A4C1T7Q6_EUMVA|nr:hypothetical protein EVAR_77620_1 [Eumeta japonica]